MSKCIDAEKLIAEIDKRLSIFEHGIAYSCWESCKKIVESLQQEQPEVDLEKEIDRLWPDLSDEISGPHNKFDIYARIARHFWNKGYNARKEE